MPIPLKFITKFPDFPQISQQFVRLCIIKEQLFQQRLRLASNGVVLHPGLPFSRSGAFPFGLVRRQLLGGGFEFCTVPLPAAPQGCGWRCCGADRTALRLSPGQWHACSKPGRAGRASSIIYRFLSAKVFECSVARWMNK